MAARAAGKPPDASIFDSRFESESTSVDESPDLTDGPASVMLLLAVPMIRNSRTRHRKGKSTIFTGTEPNRYDWIKVVLLKVSDTSFPFYFPFKVTSQGSCRRSALVVSVLDSRTPKMLTADAGKPLLAKANRPPLSSV
jgi:hypothetical protein